MSHSLFDLSGRTALVTGAGRGLGRSMALALAGAGADVAVCDLDGDTAQRVSEEIINETGRKSLAMAIDVTKPEQVDGLAEHVISTWEHLDILVNNAGINLRKPILELAPEELDRVYEVNLKGVFHCSKRFAREMIRQQYGKIVNIGSVTAITIVRGLEMIPYYLTKAGVVQFTRAASAEWGKDGVRVNCISPGWFITDINRHLWEDRDYYQMRVDQTPLGRIGEPSDLSGTVVYLASAASDFVTGQNIAVDGGYTVW